MMLEYEKLEIIFHSFYFNTNALFRFQLDDIEFKFDIYFPYLIKLQPHYFVLVIRFYYIHTRTNEETSVANRRHTCS